MDIFVDSINYTNLIVDSDGLVRMPTINANIQSLLCYSNTYEFSITNYDINTNKFDKPANILNYNSIKEYFDDNGDEAGALKSITFESNVKITETSYTSFFVMSFERWAVSLSIGFIHKEGVITDASITLCDIFFLEESHELIDFAISNQRVWLISKPNEYYLIIQEFNDDSSIDLRSVDSNRSVRNIEIPTKLINPCSILFTKVKNENSFLIAFGCQNGKIQVFTCTEENEMVPFKDYDLSKHSISFKPLDCNSKNDYISILDMSDADNKESGIGIVSTQDSNNSFFYAGINKGVKDIIIGSSLKYNNEIIPSFALITPEQKLSLFVANKEVDIKQLKQVQVTKVIWSADNRVLFLATPGKFIISLSLKKFLSTAEMVNTSEDKDVFLNADVITFKKKNLAFEKPKTLIGRGSFEDPISLDDIESPVKLDTAKTPLSGQKTMTDFFGKKMSLSPNKPQSAQKQLSFEADEPSKEESSENVFMEKIDDAFTKFEDSVYHDAHDSEENIRSLELEVKKSTITPKQSSTNDRISISNLISIDPTPEKTKESSITNTPQGLESEIPASDSATMKFHVPTHVVPKSLKRITPPEDETGLKPLAKKQKKELELLNVLDDYTLNPVLAFSKVRISVPKIRSAFQVTIKDEYSINVLNKTSNDQNPTKLFLKNVGDKEDDIHPSEAQFLPTSISLITGTPSFFAYATENGIIYICSSQTGRRLEQPLMLGVPISMLESAGNFLVCLTCVGELYCWNVEKMELAHPVASVYPILSPSLRTANDVLSRAENITSVSVTKNGVSLITLSNGDSYLYDRMMQSWSLINDSWWAYSSKHWDASNTKSGMLSNSNTQKQSIMKMLEFKTNEELKRKGQTKLIQNFTKTMLFKEGFENLEQSASMAHLFNKLYVYKKFEEFEEYQDTLIVISSTLAEFGLITMLQELFDGLFDIEDGDKIGPYKKHDLLRMSIAAVYQVGTAEAIKTARMYSDNLQ